MQKKKVTKTESVSKGFARKYIKYYYRGFWAILIVFLIFQLSK